MADQSSPIDYKMYGELEGLSNGTDEDLISSLISKFLNLLPNRLTSIESLATQGSFELIRKEVHSFKLSCQILGAENLASILADVDVASRARDSKRLGVAIEKLHINANEAGTELVGFSI